MTNALPGLPAARIGAEREPAGDAVRMTVALLIRNTMKLRIRGNTVRLRVSKPELMQIAETGAADDSTRFAVGAALRYGIEVRPTGAVTAEFDAGMVRVLIPKSSIDVWLRPEEVSKPLSRVHTRLAGLRTAVAVAHIGAPAEPPTAATAFPARTHAGRPARPCVPRNMRRHQPSRP